MRPKVAKPRRPQVSCRSRSLRKVSDDSFIPGPQAAKPIESGLDFRLPHCFVPFTAGDFKENRYFNLWIPCSLLQGEFFSASLRQLMGFSTPSTSKARGASPLTLTLAFARLAAGSRRPLCGQSPQRLPLKDSLSLVDLDT